VCRPNEDGDGGGDGYRYGGMAALDSGRRLLEESLRESRQVVLLEEAAAAIRGRTIAVDIFARIAGSLHAREQDRIRTRANALDTQETETELAASNVRRREIVVEEMVSGLEGLEARRQRLSRAVSIMQAISGSRRMVGSKAAGLAAITDARASGRRGRPPSAQRFRGAGLAWKQNEEKEGSAGQRLSRVSNPGFVDSKSVRF